MKSKHVDQGEQLFYKLYLIMGITFLSAIFSILALIINVTH